MAKKKRFPVTKLMILVIVLSFVLSAILPLLASAKKKGISLDDKQDILKDLDKKKSSLATKLKQAREKERFANNKLRGIKQKLSRAQRDLRLNQRYLNQNRDAWLKTKARLKEIEGQQNFLEKEAKHRILSIYKQDRIKLMDGLINSTSITDFLDHLYYQKRVMDFDKQVLSALTDQSENIKKYNATLSKEAAKIESITSRLKGLEREISSQKNEQSKVVSKLSKERKLFEDSERQLERESIRLIYKVAELSGDKIDNPNATGEFKYPMKARITSPFGPRRHPIFGVRSMHSGIDLAAPHGTPIKASEGGLVIYSGWYGGYGKVVIIDHSKGFTTLYAHMTRTRAKVGQKVKQGDVVGYEGSTGYATGPHLHFEVRAKGKPQNPVHYLTN